MSYRNTFTTDFIYQADGSFNVEVTKVFEDWIGSGLVSKVNDRGYGYFAGVFNGLYPTEYENDLKEIIPKLEKIIKSPLRIAVLAESGPVITYEVKPNASDLSSELYGKICSTQEALSAIKRNVKFKV